MWLKKEKKNITIWLILKDMNRNFIYKVYRNKKCRQKIC